jgi:hypothetical protein
LSASAGRPRNQLRRALADAATDLPWLVDVYRAARHPRWALDLRRDLVRTRSSSAFLRSLPSPPATAPVALVGLYRDNVYETKLALTLATALRLGGMRPLLSMPSNRAGRVRRYARAFGIDDVLAQDQLAIETADKAECVRVREQLMAGPIDFDAIKAWRFRGQSVGNHVLSTLIRVTFDGSPDLALSDNHARLASILDDVLLNTVRAQQLITTLEPRVLLVEEANYSVNGPLVDVAVDHGVDVVQTVELWREDALMSKRLTKATRRVDARSVAPETLRDLEREPWTTDRDEELDQDFEARYTGKWILGGQFQPATEPRTREQIVSEIHLDPARPTAVIFAHVLWDASLFFGVDLFANYADWLVSTIGAAVENANLNWIVKAHPSNVFRAAHGDVGGDSSEVLLIDERFPELPEHVHMLLPTTRISTLSLYDFADYGVTVRGTPGLEIACFGKAAFTAGTGSYSGLGFTYDSTTKEEYLERLASIQDSGRLPAERTERARRYAHALFLRRPWLTRSFSLEFDFPERGWHPADRNVVWRARSLDEVRRSSDLTSWAAWVTGSNDPDYLGSPEASAR